MTVDSIHKKKGWRTVAVTVTLLSSVLLSACGGDNDGDSSAVHPTHDFSSLGGKKTLVVQVDGLELAALQTAIAPHANLQSFPTLVPLLSGGYAGTSSEQPTLALPSWGSLLTGVWSIEHGVQASQNVALQSPTVFELLQQHDAEIQTALIASSPAYLEMLRNDVDTGRITQWTNCNNDDECVTQKSRQALLEGTDFVLAQYAAPIAVSTQHGLGSAQYQQQVQHITNDINELVQLVSERAALAVEESWQIMVVSSYGVDAFGSVTGSQSESNKTGFLLSNVAVSEVVHMQPDVSEKRAAVVDVVPTLLAGMGVFPEEGQYVFNGNDLRAPVQLRELTYDYSQSTYNMRLEWDAYGSDELVAPFDIYRDGVLLASVDAASRSYEDGTIPSGAVGSVLPLRYELRTKGGVVAVKTVVVPPPLLLDSVTEGMLIYYPFQQSSAIDAKGNSTLVPRNTANPGASWITDTAQLPFKSSVENTALASTALTLDLGVHAQGSYAGYRLDMPNSDVTMDPNVKAFTIGFWFKTDGVCISNGSSILANKNYRSGQNPGFVIALFAAANGCEIRINTGGKGRNDLKGFSITPEQWAYVAISVDKENQQLYGYVMDASKGQQNQVLAMHADRVAAIGGMQEYAMGVGDDMLGTYSLDNKFTGKKSYVDVAVWNRLLTLDEVRNIYTSRYPLASVLH